VDILQPLQQGSSTFFSRLSWPIRALVGCLSGTAGFECSMKRGGRGVILRLREHLPEVHQHSGQAGILASGFITSEGGGSPPAVADRRFTEGLDLVRASDSDSALEARAQDIHDRGGQEIGTLEDLYVDSDEATARFLIPLEAVGGISAGWMRLNHDRDKIADSPSFEQKAEGDRRYQTAIYRYYGYCWAKRMKPPSMQHLDRAWEVRHVASGQ
jgi:hypothetical protein